MRLWMRVYIVTLPLALLILIICSAQLLSISYGDMMRREYERALSDYAMLTAALSTHVNATSDTFERDAALRARAVSAAVQNYGRYYTGDDVALAIADAQENSLYSGMTPGESAAAALSPPHDGRRTYVVRKLEDRTLLFVSGWLSVGDDAFRVDYMRDISSAVEGMLSSAWRISFFLLGAAIVLGCGLYVMISAAMRPLHALSVHARALSEGNYSRRIAPGRGEVGELAQAFNDMADAVEERIRELESAAQDRDVFIANLAHEIKTPVTTIMGYADLLGRARLTPEQTARALGSIREVSARLDALSKKLLSLFRIQGTAALTPRPESIPALFARVETALALHILQSGVTLRIECGLDEWTLDAELFALLLINLTENAIKASGSGDTVTLSAQRLEGGAVFCVADQGCGIPESELSRVRQPFYMVDKARSRGQNGAGLGLTLCEAIANAHGAALEIESREGAGTVVKILFRG